MNLAGRMHVRQFLNEMEESSSTCPCENLDCFVQNCKHGALYFKYLSVFCSSYFQKVPAEAPQLELKANYGLVEPVPFEFPALNAHWTPETVAAFDLTKRPKEDTVR